MNTIKTTQEQDLSQILLIGNEGYIGSRLQEYLDRLNCNVVGLDIGWFGKKRGTIVGDYNALTIEEIHQFDVVILLGGHSSVQMCERNDVSAINNNVRNFINLINKLGKDHIFIYASSASVYGNNESTNINTYDYTKQTIDDIIQRTDLHYYGLRFGSVNGFSLNQRTDLVINNMVLSAKTTGKIDLYHSTARRGITYIVDICRSVHKIIECATFEKRGIYDIFSYNTTIGEIAEQIAANLGCEIVQHDPTELKNHYDYILNQESFIENFNFTTDKVDTSDIIKDLNNMELTANPRDQKIYYI